MAEIPKIQWVVSVLWPGFLVAGAGTIVTFTLFDPVEMSACIGGPEISRTGAYSLGFFLYWLMTSLSSILTCYFQRPCDMAGRPDQPG
jgi:hypothetical protein